MPVVSGENLLLYTWAIQCCGLASIKTIPHVVALQADMLNHIAARLSGSFTANQVRHKASSDSGVPVFYLVDVKCVALFWLMSSVEQCTLFSAASCVISQMPLIALVMHPLTIIAGPASAEETWSDC